MCIFQFCISRDDANAEQEIGGMPGVFRYGVVKLIDHLNQVVPMGLSSVLLFGVPMSIPKDDRGSGADHPATPVIQAITEIKKRFPTLLIACDVRPFLVFIFQISRWG